MPKNKNAKPNSLQEKVLSVFRANPTLAMNYKQVSRQLKITQTSKKKIIA